jgi:hypothetical protein
MTAKKKTKPKAAPRKRKPAKDNLESYSEILAMLDQLLDTAEDDLARASMDPLAAVRAKCATLTVALRMCLLALSCHGQKEDFARQIAQNLDQIVDLKTRWNEESDQESIRQKVVENLISENEIEDEKRVQIPRPEKRRFSLVQETYDENGDPIEDDESDDYEGPIEVESEGYAEDNHESEIE